MTRISRKEITKVCKACDNEFITDNPRKEFCGKKCCRIFERGYMVGYRVARRSQKKR